MYRSLETESFDLYTLRALKDNFIYLIVSKPSQKTLVIDPSEATPVFEALKQLQRPLDFIINTHHHPDHTGGNSELKEAFDCSIYGPEKECGRIPGLDQPLLDIDRFIFESLKFEVIEVPGHTIGHIALYEPKFKLLFSGDVLFCFGCGRVFEGTHEMMNESLKKLSRLPADTLVFCGHEYALQNLEFALVLEPDNKLLQAHLRSLRSKLKSGQPSVPSLLGEELKSNPFLKTQTVESFSKIRKLKDQFKPSLTKF